MSACSGLGGVYGVEEHRRRIGARLLADDLGSGPLPPGLQLLHRRRPKGVGGAHQHLPPFPHPEARQLAGGGGLAHAVDPDHQQDLEAGCGRPVARGGTGLQNMEELRSDTGLELAGIVDAVPLYPVPDPVEDHRGGIDPHVGPHQDFLELLKQFRINRLPALQHLFHAGHQVPAGRRHGRPEPAQKTLPGLPIVATAARFAHDCLRRTRFSGR